MKRRLVQTLASIAIVCASTLCAETLFYVSPEGNDAWSGLIPVPGKDAKDGPFASPGRARKALLEAKSKGASGPFAVELRGGLYELRETLAFTPEDSGTKESPVVWRAYGSERPLLSGGRLLSGFKESSEGGLRRWTLEIPEVKAGAWNFRQLFVSKDGAPFERRYRPQLGMKALRKLSYSPMLKDSTSHRPAQKDFLFYPGDIGNWENIGDVEAVILHLWTSSRIPLSRVDLKSGIVELAGLPSYPVNDSGPHSPYFLENVKEALAKPGEWHLDRPSGVLSYLPKEGETLANMRLLAPALVNVMSVKGDRAKGLFVSGLRFSGLSFSHTEWPLPSKGYGSGQGQPELPAAVELLDARDCSFFRCSVANVGEYGISLGLGCQGSRIEGCRLYDLGGGGVKIGDPRMGHNETEPALPSGNSIVNCAISDGGVIYYSANAVWCGIVKGTVIRNNEIWNFPYTGIAVGWSWRDNPSSCGGNIIERNLIRNVVALLADGASVYTLGRQPGSVIRGNILRDNPKNPFAREHWQLGLYLDEGSSEILVEKNLVLRVGTHGFNMNGGAQNIIRDNILGPVHDKSSPFIRCHKREDAKANVFTRNICFCDSENMADAEWGKELLDCKQNLYWNFAGLPLRFKKANFQAWQASGQDQGSLNADPLFADPAQDDFRLKPESPAFKLGFEPFDFQAAGLEEAFKDLRAPVPIAPPPVYSMKPPLIQYEGPDAELGFEEVPPGMLPHELRPSVAKGEEKDVRATDEDAKSGRISVKLIHRKSQPKPYLPYLTWRPERPVKEGVLKMSCELKQDAKAPSPIAVCFRDYKSHEGRREYVDGPGVQIDASGNASVKGKPLASVKPGSWLRLEMEFALGDEKRREAIVSIIAPDGARSQLSTPLEKEFQLMTDLLFVTGGPNDGSFYLDDLSVKVK